MADRLSMVRKHNVFINSQYRDTNDTPSSYTFELPVYRYAAETNSFSFNFAEPYGLSFPNASHALFGFEGAPTGNAITSVKPKRT